METLRVFPFHQMITKFYFVLLLVHQERPGHHLPHLSVWFLRDCLQMSIWKCLHNKFVRSSSKETLILSYTLKCFLAIIGRIMPHCCQDACPNLHNQGRFYLVCTRHLVNGVNVEDFCMGGLPLNYLSGPNLTRWILKRTETFPSCAHRGMWAQKWCQTDATLLLLKMKKGNHSQGIWAAFKSWKRQKGFSLEPLGKTAVLPNTLV